MGEFLAFLIFVNKRGRSRKTVRRPYAERERKSLTGILKKARFYLIPRHETTKFYPGWIASRPVKSIDTIPMPYLHRSAGPWMSAKLGSQQITLWSCRSREPAIAKSTFCGFVGLSGSKPARTWSEMEFHLNISRCGNRSNQLARNAPGSTNPQFGWRPPQGPLGDSDQ